MPDVVLGQAGWRRHHVGALVRTAATTANTSSASRTTTSTTGPSSMPRTSARTINTFVFGAQSADRTLHGSPHRVRARTERLHQATSGAHDDPTAAAGYALQLLAEPVNGLQRRGDAPVDQCAQQLLQAAQETRERGQQPLRKALDELQEMHRLAHDEADGRPHLDPRRVFGPLLAAVSWTRRRLPARGRTRCSATPRRDGVQPQRLPDASGVRAAARRCQLDAQAASGSAPNAVLCHPPPRWCPAERLPDRPSTRHDQLRLSEPGCQQRPATPGRRPASPACRHPGSRPGGPGSHPCLSGWRSMSWLAPSVTSLQRHHLHGTHHSASGQTLTEQECRRLPPTLVPRQATQGR